MGLVVQVFPISIFSHSVLFDHLAKSPDLNPHHLPFICYYVDIYEAMGAKSKSKLLNV